MKLHDQLWAHQKAFLAAGSTYESRRCFGNEKLRERSKEANNSNSTSRISALLVREVFTSVLHVIISLTTVTWD